MHNRTLKQLLAPSLLTLAMFAGATQANATRVIRDHEGNRWDVYVSDRTERWTDAYGNVTTCRYEAGFKTCKFPDPSTIKVAARSKATAG